MTPGKVSDKHPQWRRRWKEWCLAAALGAVLALPGPGGSEEQKPPAPASAPPPAAAPATANPASTAPAAGTGGSTQSPPRIPFPGTAPATTTTTSPTPAATEPPAWSTIVAGKKGKLNLDFRGADIDNVLKFYSMASGVTITKDPALKGPVTIVSAKSLTLDEAFRILEAVLNSKNFKLTKEGPVLRVVALAQQQQQPSWSSWRDMVRAEDQQPQVNEIRVFELKFADAQQVARVINDVFPQRGGAMAAIMAQQSRRFGGFSGRGGASNISLGPEVRASADDYTNSVVVNASPDYMPKIETLIKSLDKEVTSTMQTRVFPLQFASATEVSDVIASVLMATAPGQRTAASQSLPFEQRIRGSGGSGRSAYFAVRSQCVPNERTNSIVVTATPTTLALVESVIKELDQPVEFETTTYVLPLDNAQAQDVAQLLNQALRSTTGGGTGYSSAYRGSSSYRPQSSYRPNSSRPSYGGSSRSVAMDGPAHSRAAGGRPDDVDVREPDGDADLPPEEDGMQDAPDSRQYGGYRGGGGYSYGSRGIQTTGRDAGGRIVNLLNLGGQATIVADPNTNALIINTTPENYAAIKEIVKQLDAVPEQVLIEALVVEASLDSTSKLGMEWTWVQDKLLDTKVTANAKLPNADLATAPFFRFSVVGQSLQTVLSALATDKRFNVLSTPRIFTSNNRQAQINISQRVPYVVSTRETDAGTISYNYGYLDVGLVLDVTPHITQNGMVNIEVTQEANELQGFTAFQAPLISNRSANTTISVRDGETVILGGMIREQKDKTVNKTPILGDIPILGSLFRSHGTTRGKTELMVFLTPRVVRTNEEAARLTQEQQQQVRVLLPPYMGAAPGAGPVPGAGPGQPPKGSPFGDIPAPTGAPAPAEGTRAPQSPAPAPGGTALPQAPPAASQSTAAPAEQAPKPAAPPAAPPAEGVAPQQPQNPPAEGAQPTPAPPQPAPPAPPAESAQPPKPPAEGAQPPAAPAPPAEGAGAAQPPAGR